MQVIAASIMELSVREKELTRVMDTVTELVRICHAGIYCISLFLIIFMLFLGVTAVVERPVIVYVMICDLYMNLM